jgi:hypothetical protein
LFFISQVFGQHVQVHFLLHAGNAFHATGHVHIAFARNDALRGQCNGLQAGRTKAVDGHARHGDGQPARKRDLARDVGAGGTLRGWRSP